MVEKASDMILQNVRGLRTKIDAFFLAVSDAEYDIIVLTETWLNDQIFSVQLFGHLYAVYRSDRSPLNSHKTRGGGVLIAVSKKFSSSIDQTFISVSLEQLWVLVELPRDSLNIEVIYLPPDRKIDSVSINEHIDSLSSISFRLSPRTPALLFGDYNQYGLRWCFPEGGLPLVDPLLSQIPTACSALLDGFNLNGFTQINTLLNRNDRLLDLILANDVALPVTNVFSPVEPLIDLDADHPALGVEFRIPTPIEYDEPSISLSLDFRRVDYAELNDLPSVIDWRFIERTANVSDAVECFCDAVESVVSHAVPASRPPLKPPWSNPRLRALKRTRSATLRKYCNTRSQYIKQQLNTVTRQYRRYNIFLYRCYIKRIGMNLRRNPKRFWSFVNSERRVAGLPPSMYLTDETARNEK
ncbi:uncharacterized protein LOC131433893 [Malaya genurostris]|uniref:uncharacterized protein LOC131433893 n=1 Tax=Malaya genurostris TaxID=325434 RepID=UPI0026F3F5E3|nr:uncharacterized protein LOC131433893 [Malaya genurostris]